MNTSHEVSAIFNWSTCHSRRSRVLNTCGSKTGFGEGNVTKLRLESEGQLQGWPCAWGMEQPT